ncbi:MAG: hypothetical protein ABIY62_04360 [Ginsengibacter sp.]
MKPGKTAAFVFERVIEEWSAMEQRAMERNGTIAKEKRKRLCAVDLAFDRIKSNAGENIEHSEIFFTAMDSL